MNKVKFEDGLNVLDVAGFNFCKIKKFNLKKYILTINITISIFSGLMELILNFRGMPTLERAAQSLIPESEVALKIILISLYQNQIVYLIKESDNFWKLDSFGDLYKKKFQKPHKLLEKFAKIFKYTVQAGCTGYVLINAIVYRNMPIVFAYNENKGIPTPFFQIYFIIHFSAVYHGCFAVVGFDMIFFYLIGHIFTELKMLKVALKHENILTKRRQKLQILIKHHIFVLDFIKKFNQISSGMLMIQNMICMFALCLFLFIMSENMYSLYYTEKEEPYLLIKMVPTMCIYLFQLFLYSFAGQIITDASSEISQAFFYNCFETNTFDKNQCQSLMICVQRSQLEAKLTTGPFGVANFQSFTGCIKTAFSFLAFLNTINGK